MPLQRRKFLQLAAGGGALLARPYVARAQAYPTQPVRIIAGFLFLQHGMQKLFGYPAPPPGGTRQMPQDRDRAVAHGRGSSGADWRRSR